MHITYDQMHHIRSNWLGPFVFILETSLTKGLLALLHLGLAGVTEVNTNPKRRFVSFKGTLFTDRVLCVYASLGHNTMEQLAWEHFFEGLQDYMKNKSGGNGSKIILGDFNCSMDKMDRDGGKKTQKGYGCGSKYSHSKFINNSGFKDL